MGTMAKTQERRRKREQDSPSESTARELRMAFAMLDRSRSGRVSVDDIDQTMQSLGFEAKDDEIKTFVKSVANGGQVIREHEFVSSMEDLGLVASRGSVVKQAFHTFDRDNDGFINKNDLQEGLKLIGEKVSDKCLDLMVTMADSDADGKLDLKDFTRALES